MLGKCEQLPIAEAKLGCGQGKQEISWSRNPDEEGLEE